MPFSNSSEEKYPLLLLLVDDGKGGKSQRRVIIDDKNRFSGITSGATAVITQWPGHLTSCWITMIFCMIMIFLVGLLAFAASFHPSHHSLKARCVGNHNNDDSRLDNRTIHLVHGPEFWHPTQLRVVQQIAHDYPDCKIHLILLENNHNKVILRKLQEVSDPDTTPYPIQHYRKPYRIIVKRQTKRRKRKTDLNQIQRKIKRETKKILNMLLGQKKSANVTTPPPSLEITEASTETEELHKVEELLEKHPDIILTRITYEEVFAHSPLHFSWKNLNEQTLIFAVRVLYLWQYGGISFDLLGATDPVEPPTHNSSASFTYKNLQVSDSDDDTNNTESHAEKIISFVRLVLPTLNNIPGGMVTIDEDGVHMETGTPCHAFFGELLMALGKSKKETTVKKIVRDSLRVFCKQGAVDSAYCNSI